MDDSAAVAQGACDTAAAIITLSLYGTDQGLDAGFDLVDGWIGHGRQSKGRTFALIGAMVDMLAATVGVAAGMDGDTDPAELWRELALIYTNDRP